VLATVLATLCSIHVGIVAALVLVLALVALLVSLRYGALCGRRARALSSRNFLIFGHPPRQGRRLILRFLRLIRRECSWNGWFPALIDTVLLCSPLPHKRLLGDYTQSEPCRHDVPTCSPFLVVVSVLSSWAKSWKGQQKQAAETCT